MTTVAIDRNGWIAADGLAVMNGQIPLQYDAQKIFKFTHEDESFFVGMAGDYSVILEAVEYLEELLYGGLPEGVNFNPEAISIVKLNNQGEVYLGQVASSGSKIVWMHTGDNYLAIGSGMDAAIAAMHCGLSAEESVAVASKVDVHTGGEVTAFHYSELDFYGDMAEAFEREAESLKEQAQALRQASSEESCDEQYDTCLQEAPESVLSDVMEEDEERRWDELESRLKLHREHLDTMQSYMRSERLRDTTSSADINNNGIRNVEFHAGAIIRNIRNDILYEVLTFDTGLGMSVKDRDGNIEFVLPEDFNWFTLPK